MPTARRHPHVVHLEEAKSETRSHGKRFGYTDRWLSDDSGARGIGCSWYEVPPGRTAFPAHYHCANEEAAFILEGEGTLRLGAAKIPVRAGDYVTFPTGPDFAHQLINTGTAPLRYLALSTLLPVDVVGYPDSKKLGARAVGPGEQPWVRETWREGSGVGYYDGEPD